MQSEISIVPPERAFRPKGEPVIRIEAIGKEYAMGDTTIRALRGIDLLIHRNEYLAIMGRPVAGNRR